MAKRRKLEKITELKVLPNVFESPEGIKGNWHSTFFENDNPITLEIGCGRGEYTVNLARMFPERNFIGADIKGPRLWKGAKIAAEEELDNAAFVRTLIENITDYFAPGEVAEIWVTFPDPYPKPSKSQKRLISARFRELYKNILQSGGFVHFKTDNTGLFDWALEDLKADKDIILYEHTKDLYSSELVNDVTSIKTTYEGMFLAEGKSIKYLKFSFKSL